jgi:sulfate adenylyltransferase (ADP) / ATP adenylyltransferase
VIADLALKPDSLDPVTSPALPFRHAILPLGRAPSPAGKALLRAYQTLLAYLGIDGGEPLQAFPYNLLVTRDWMMVVARQQEHYQSIPVNSLGFAGSLLVKNLEQFDLLKTLGPMTILKQVACPEPSDH